MFYHVRSGEAIPQEETNALWQSIKREVKAALLVLCSYCEVIIVLPRVSQCFPTQTLINAHGRNSHQEPYSTLIFCEVTEENWRAVANLSPKAGQIGNLAPNVWTPAKRITPKTRGYEPSTPTRRLSACL
ncbi:uncharacterized protein P174DRAFT_49464 [Aspergillus novofumigatus IBT 16806]|uniref:Uncharacterized protein n=1 Tax=Aspergillus novofumigatus (strain IBT 16806) TaxID=1392255 RepID=A0A2I1CPE5_ASPN1|nr:uncharacterized protein P174DRAFT_49464 [Aspergillus novofumigatus IBT 16806]PKX99489.1 hypothetical protein P174DRAFT_49464 [Aspergillus novofumigatus IBT 16806]